MLEVDDNDVIRFCFMAKGSKPGLAAAVNSRPGMHFYDETMKCVGEIGLDEDSSFCVQSGSASPPKEPPLKKKRRTGQDSK